jgi:hypothetical protein
MSFVSRKLVGVFALAAGAALLSSRRAGAQIVDFEAGPFGSCFESTCLFGGFQFDFVADGWGIDSDGNTFFNRSGDPSAGVLGAYGGFLLPEVTVTMSKIGGGEFSVSSFLAAVGDPGAPGPSEMDITGFLSGGGTMSASVTLFHDFASYSLAGFDHLTSVEFSNSDPASFSGMVGLSLDDINTTATPEPASVALIATGLVGLAAFGRRRRRNNA